MITESGRVEVVRLATVGTNARGDQLAGAIVVDVADASVFHSLGGSVQVNHYVADVLTPVTYDYVSADATFDRVTLATALTLDVEDGTPIRPVPLAVEKRAHVRKDHGQDSIEARVPHGLEPYLVDGIRDPDTEEAVTITQAQPGGEWLVADIHGKDPVARTADYDPGQSGSSFGTAVAQFDSVNVTDTLGASLVTADAVSLGGDDLASLLARKAGGVVSFAQAATTTDTAAVSAETIMFQIDLGGPLTSDRFYLVCVRGSLNPASTTAATFRVRARISKATSGSAAAATLSDVIWDGSSRDITPANSTERGVLNNFWLWQPDGEYTDVKIAVTLERISASGTGAIDVGANFRFQVFLVDLGGSGFAAGALAQKSKATGSPDPNPISAYVGVFPAIAAEAYDEDGTVRQDNSSMVFQGKNPFERSSSGHGNSKSLLLFNTSSIATVLAGATVTKVELTFRVSDTAFGDYGTWRPSGSLAGGAPNGVSVRVRSHNNASLPGTYAAGSEIAHLDGCKTGGTYTVVLPTSFGDDLKNSLAKGVGFGPGPNDSAGYFGALYGLGASVPVLRITYSK